jgi:hypothetical protein
MLNPLPWQLVLLVMPWRHAMGAAIGSIKLDKLFKLHVPLLIMFRHGSQKTLSSKKTKVGGCQIAKKRKPVVLVNANSTVRWQTTRNDRFAARSFSFLVF